MTAASPSARERADPWRELGLAPGASADEVGRAWRALAARHHPDVGGDPERFRRLVAARDELVAVGRRAGEPVSVIARPGPAATLLRPLRRRYDRRFHPRVE